MPGCREEAMKTADDSQTRTKERMNMSMRGDNGPGMPSSPVPLLQFMFAMFAMLTALSTFVRLSADEAFVMGVLQVCLGIGAFVGSIMNLRDGNPHGNINLILSVILGFAGGITQMAGVYAKLHQIHFHPWIMSVILLMGGLYMLCFLPLMKTRPLYAYVSHLSVVLGFFCNSLSDLLSIPVLKTAGACFLVLFSITALYQGVVMMYAQYGMQLPQGPAAEFWKKKVKKSNFQ